jgi:hypothetical protein
VPCRRWELMWNFGEGASWAFEGDDAVAAKQIEAKYENSLRGFWTEYGVCLVRILFLQWEERPGRFCRWNENDVV